MRKHTPNDNPLWEDLFKGGSLRRVTRWENPSCTRRPVQSQSSMRT